MGLDWYPGQKIVCVWEGPWSDILAEGPSQPKLFPILNKIYTIQSIKTMVVQTIRSETNVFVELVEIPGDSWEQTAFRLLRDVHSDAFRKMVSPENLKNFKEPDLFEKVRERLHELDRLSRW